MLLVRRTSYFCTGTIGVPVSRLGVDLRRARGSKYPIFDASSSKTTPCVDVPEGPGLRN